MEFIYKMGDFAVDEKLYHAGKRSGRGYAYLIASGMLFSLLSGIGVGRGSAATYYVDYAGGSNSNSGVSSAAAWKHAPGMQGCGGNCAAILPQAGDRFIFKGGVTWDHNCFEMDISWSGSAGNPIYFGVDKTWFAGSSWSRPVFSGDYTRLAKAESLLATASSYITIDNIEFRALRAYSNWGSASVSHNCSKYLLMQNLYVHDWQLDTSVKSDDAHGGVIGNYPSCAPTGVLLTNSIVSNTEAKNAGRQNGVAVRATDIAYSTIFDVATSQLFGLVHDSLIYNVSSPASNESFDPNYHTNVTYVQHWDGVFDSNQYTRPGLIYNNVIHDIAAGSGAFYLNGCPNTAFYVFNNVVYNDDGYNVQIDQYPTSSGSCGSFYIWNNTFEQKIPGRPNMRQVPRGANMAVLQTINNHFIQDGGSQIDIGSGATSLSNSNNVEQTHAAATLQGYLLANFFAPTQSTNATVGGGSNLTSNCSAALTSLCSDTTLGNTKKSSLRPASGAWDVGAFALGGGSAAPNPPSGLTVTVY